MVADGIPVLLRPVLLRCDRVGPHRRRIQMRVVAALSGEAFLSGRWRIPEKILERVDGSADILQNLPIQRDAIVLGQAGQSVYLLIERDRALVVRALRGEQQEFAAFALYIAPSTVRP